ncbi:histidine kinase, partial [bacterium]|nr:histidine kinase [bacterium]
MIADRIVNQAQEKVELDLNSAREVYNDKIRDVSTSIRLTAPRFFLKDATLKNDVKMLEVELKKIRESELLDILTLTDKDGRVLIRTRNPEAYGDSQGGDELIREVIRKKEIVASTQIISKEELLKEGGDLAKQAHIEFISTPKAKPRPEKEENSGMMIKAAAPILDYHGNLIGILYGGNLLNRNYEI